MGKKTEFKKFKKNIINIEVDKSPLAIANQYCLFKFDWNCRAKSYIEDEFKKNYIVTIEGYIPHEFNMGRNNSDECIHIEDVGFIIIDKETNDIIKHTTVKEINEKIVNVMNEKLIPILLENQKKIEAELIECGYYNQDNREIEIKKTIKLIEKAWLKMSTLRLGQFLLSTIRLKVKNNSDWLDKFWKMGDKKLFRILELKYK